MTPVEGQRCPKLRIPSGICFHIARLMRFNSKSYFPLDFKSCSENLSGPMSRDIAILWLRCPLRRGAPVGLALPQSCNTMRAEIIAYMIYLEGPEYPEYVMHIFYLKYSGTPRYGNMLGNSLPVRPAQETTENYLKYSGCPQ